MKIVCDQIALAANPGHAGTALRVSELGEDGGEEHAEDPGPLVHHLPRLPAPDLQLLASPLPAQRLHHGTVREQQK